MELISYFYTPTPQRDATYGNVDPLTGTPALLDDWITPEWVDWMTHENPDTPWMDQRLKAQVENFELILKSRFPSVHDRRTRPWGKAVAQWLARRRWAVGNYADPHLLRHVRRLAQHTPDDRQAYGHLRPVGAA